MIDELEYQETQRQLRRLRRERRSEQQKRTSDSEAKRRKSVRSSYRLADVQVDEWESLPRLQCRARRALSSRETRWS